jgi:UDP-N-acetylmuramyl pentapeptide synthase
MMIFCSIRGTISDGHDFIEKAILQGAGAVI